MTSRVLIFPQVDFYLPHHLSKSQMLLIPNFRFAYSIGWVFCYMLVWGIEQDNGLWKTSSHEIYNCHFFPAIVSTVIIVYTIILLLNCLIYLIWSEDSYSTSLLLAEISRMHLISMHMVEYGYFRKWIWQQIPVLLFKIYSCNYMYEYLAYTCVFAHVYL